VSAVPVRERTHADCDRVAEIRVRGRRTAYRGLMPQAYLDGLDVAEDAARHRARLAGGGGRAVNLVAEQEGEVTGWAAFGSYRDGDAHTADAELYALYVHPGHQSRGAGRALLAETVRRCSAAGRPRVFLWVLRDNARARRFSERAGFRPDGAEEAFEAGGVAVPEVRYVTVPHARPDTAPGA
jgi:ribosomal protein S18 acetylase RimI-like enzyme